MGQHKEFANVH